MIILKLIYKMLLWVPLAIAAVVLKLFSFLLGWLFIAPFIWLGKDGNLPEPVRSVFQPDDSLAIGDDPKVTDFRFQDREGAFTKKYPEWIRNYILCVMWSCMRNPAYGWDSKVCGIDSNINIIKSYGPDVRWGYDAKENAVYQLGTRFIVTDKGNWNLIVAFVFPFTTHGFLCSFGWNLQGDVVNSKIRNLKIDIAGKSSAQNKV
jgi:hypothetical protein